LSLFLETRTITILHVRRRGAWSRFACVYRSSEKASTYYSE